MTVNAHDIARLQAMDEVAWADLQEDFFRRVYYYVKRYVSDHQTAENITQDVFLGAVKGIERFDAQYTVEQFLFGIGMQVSSIQTKVVSIHLKHSLCKTCNFQRILMRHQFYYSCFTTLK